VYLGTVRFEGFEGRRVVAAFDGGAMTSDGGGLLLRHTDRALGLIERVAACFQDNREQDQVVHTLAALIGQRIVGIALGEARPRAGKAGPVGGRERP
jgi:Transposase DDE domain group 1